MKNSEIHVMKTLKVPISLVWKVWINPQHIASWWGPDGFTNTIHTMDFRENGEWRLTMHGPDGTNYPNRSIFREIIPLEKIVFEHFNPHFFTTVIFTAKDAETTIDWTMRFDTAEMLETVVKVHKADEGLQQNLERLGKYLSILPGT